MSNLRTVSTHNKARKPSKKVKPSFKATPVAAQLNSSRSALIKRPRHAISYARIDSLRPNPKNARVHGKRQIRKLADAIREFGIFTPILIDSDCNVYAGHGRLEAAKLLGMTEVPVIQINHLTTEQLRAFSVADNRLSELAKWDADLLATELKELTDLNLDFDLDVTGFEVAEMDLMFLNLPGAQPAQDDSNEVIPEIPAAAISQLGDLWLLGPHRILCGNSLEGSSFEAVLGGRLADVVFTDPPYGVRIDGHVSGLGKIKHREFVMGGGDMSPDGLVDFFRQTCRNLARYSRPGSIHYICIDWRHVERLLTAAKGSLHTLLNLVVWVKNNAGMGSFYRSQHELLLVYKNGKGKHTNNVQLGKFGRHRSNVWHYQGVNAFARQTDEGRLAELHPTIKPVDMVADALLDSTARGEVVLDAFLGSGSTLIGAERIGRICCGIELDARYVDVAIQRWQRHTGDFAVHAVSGRRFDEIARVKGAARGK